MTIPHLSPSLSDGNLVFTSGQLAFNDGRIEGDIVAQTRQAIDNLVTVLAAAGLGLDDVVKTTIWLTKRENFAGFNDAYAAKFGAHRPARSTTICDLAIGEALVEIEAVACRRSD
jgi:2-iminobutanoate/2-iminopropanoate deaminase